MPVYWFALSQTKPIPIGEAVLCFIILHLFIYPASNAYNSYMDQDDESIGGLKNPPKATKRVYYLSIIFDLVGLALSITLNSTFFVLILLYISASRAYSYKRIRLKKYPIIGFITVALFQGGFTYLMVKTSMYNTFDLHLLYNKEAMIASSLLIGGVYPLTQIYQHEADKRNGDATLSMLLGIRGTFVFSAILFGVANLFLMLHFISIKKEIHFYIFQLCLLPLVVYFIRWAISVWKNNKNASYENTMRMNTISSITMSCCFIMILFFNHLYK